MGNPPSLWGYMAFVLKVPYLMAEACSCLWSCQFTCRPQKDCENNLFKKGRVGPTSKMSHFRHREKSKFFPFSLSLWWERKQIFPAPTHTPTLFYRQKCASSVKILKCLFIKYSINSKSLSLAIKVLKNFKRPRALWLRVSAPGPNLLG